ncbi:glycosyltransferase family 2 protein [Arthrobacter sp. SX1312]|uniref:glycosyltransferase n=1 Tax=Arthrobacter sp. SX1312 TaxID=2058896 RepID=UPI000CE4B6EE|nr:glycosyltransferase family 2 protein [Arthrobacter sp. SX1312]
MSVDGQAGLPNVSLVIPAFNEQATIRRCLLAAIHQTVPAKQIIVVDNGSTDGTGAVVARMQEDHPGTGIMLLQQNAEQGIIPTRDFGFQEAGGEVLGRIDADSLVEPDWVEQVQQAFMDPDIAAVTGPVIYYDMPWRRLGLKADNAVRKVVMRWASPRYPFLFGSNMAIRRSAWQQIQSHTCRDASDEMHEDIDLSLHLSDNGLRIAYLSTMVAGVSARRLENSPECYRYYVDRFDRTYRAHQVSGWALKVPSMIFRAIYLPLKLLRTLNATGAVIYSPGLRTTR